MDEKIKELEDYLNDLDNLIDTGWFAEEPVDECVFYHKGMTLRDFVQKGRAYIGEYLLSKKSESN